MGATAIPQIDRACNKDHPSTQLLVQNQTSRSRDVSSAYSPSSSGAPSNAWGIYFKEDWNWPKVWWLLRLGFFLPSILFGILWGILRKDIQGAFGVASLWMAGSAILIGIVGTLP